MIPGRRGAAAAALAALLAAFAPAAAADSSSAAAAPAASSAAGRPPEKHSPLVKQYYQEALQFYAHGDYRQAIIKWNAVLKEAPEQTTAPVMILEARRRLLLENKARRQHVFEFIAAGQYRKALIELQALLDQDPGDPQLLALQARLESIIKLTPAVLPASKAARAAILGLKGYLSLPPDLTLAHNGLRYAVEIAPDEGLYKKFLGLLIAEFPVLTTLDPITPGMKLLEYKSVVAMHQIYDGKYHTAVLTLDEILALDPDDLLALKRKGSAYYSLGRMDDARAAWTAALKIQPRDKTLLLFIAKTRAPAAKTYTKGGRTP